MTWGYSTQPRNDFNEDRVRDIAREEFTSSLRSQSLLGSIVPGSLPQNAVVTPFVTQLPVNAKDGDEVRFLADSAAGVVWHLRYRAAAASNYRWEYIGGPPLYAHVATAEARSTNSYGALTTAGPTLTIPAIGEYLVTQSAEIQVDTNALTHGLMSYDVVTIPPSTTWSVGFVSSTALHRAQVSRTYLHGIAILGTLVAKYQSATSNSVTFSFRSLSAIPVRVGRT